MITSAGKFLLREFTSKMDDLNVQYINLSSELEKAPRDLEYIKDILHKAKINRENYNHYQSQITIAVGLECNLKDSK